MLLGRRCSSLKADIVVYEKLNMLTLLLCFINRFRYSKQYFIDFSPFVKKHLFTFVNKNKIQQINQYAFLGSHGIWARSSKLAVENVNKIMQSNPKLAEPFTAYFKDDRAISIIKKIYTMNLKCQSYKGLILKEFCSRYKDNLILYFPTENNLVIEYLAGSSVNVKILRWHFALLYLVGFLKNLICFIGLVICPFFLLLRIAKHSRITFRFNSKKVIRKALFVHVNDLLSNRFYRNMYLFNIKALKISDCIHTCIRRPLSTNKINYIKEKGGFVLLDYRKQSICMSLIFKKLFIKYYKCFFVHFYSLTFNKFISFQTLRHIIALIYTSVLFENLLAWMDVKFAFFESEADKEVDIFTIIAKEYNVKTVTMLHGIGAYCNTCFVRSNTVVNYYIVSGNYYNRYLKPSCPHVDEFYTIGIHEIEKVNGNDNKTCLHYLKKDGRKIVGVLAAFYYFFPATAPYWGGVFDERDLRNAFIYNWGPFFDWASKRKDVFLILKGKNPCFEHPFLKEQLAKLSSDKYYQNDVIPITDVLDVSDYIICSGESSIQFDSLAYGVPAIAYEFMGYVDSKRYSEYLVAEEPDEFLLKLDYLMSHGLPDEVYRDFCRDHHLSNSRSNLSSLRIKKLIDKLVEK